MLKQPADGQERLRLYQAMSALKHTADGQTIIKYLKTLIL